MTMAAPIDIPRHRLWVLTRQFLHHKPHDGQTSGEAAIEVEATSPVPQVGGRNLDDRINFSSAVGFSETASPSPRLPSPEPFIPKRAAVLVCLFEGENGDIRVILTKRSDNLSTHSAEVSLPGGKPEAGDANDVATATREAQEEIGLAPSLVAVVAVLEPFLSRVVPVLGVLLNKQAFIPALNPAEVDDLFDAPLEMFLKDENHRSEEKEWLGKKYVLHYFDYEVKKKKFLVWGLTAGILIHAASVVYQRQPSFSKMKQKYEYYTNMKG